MADIAPILDYASPRKRVRLRLPAKSRIRCQSSAGRLTIIESLDGQGGAIGAIVFAVLVLIYLGLISAFLKGGIAVIALPWIAEATVLVMVVHQTWRKTLLTVTPEEVRLRFTSPLTSKIHEWPASDVGEIRAIQTGTSRGGRPLGELRIILSSGGEVRLFSDHRAEEINDLVTGILDALRGELIDEVAPSAVPVRDHALDASQTSGRLVDLHRQLRSVPLRTPAKDPPENQPLI